MGNKKEENKQKQIAAALSQLKICEIELERLYSKLGEIYRDVPVQYVQESGNDTLKRAKRIIEDYYFYQFLFGTEREFENLDTNRGYLTNDTL